MESREDRRRAALGMQMSNGFHNFGECSHAHAEAVRLVKMCKERYRSDATVVSGPCDKDKKYITELENKMRNYFQEIGFLQDQLNLRDAEVNFLGEHVHSLELKLAEANKLHEKLRLSRDEAMQSDSRCLLLMQELEEKHSELQKLNSQIGKLEAIISSVFLESQCEVESMRLEIANLEQRYFEAERLLEHSAQEKTRMNACLEECSSQVEEQEQVIKALEIENKELQEKFRVSEENTEALVQKVREYLNKWFNSNCKALVHVPRKLDKHLFTEQEDVIPLPNELWEILELFVSRLTIATVWDENIRDDMEKMLNRIQESDCLISQLKEELRREKLRAKEDAEDLAQEMAELRYHVTGMLEEECKRRACIEHASIRRIQELETQLMKERSRASAVIKHPYEDQDDAEFDEVHHLTNTVKHKVDSCSST